MQAEVASDILVKCNDPDIHSSINRVETFPLHRDILVIFKTIHELNDVPSIERFLCKI